MTIEKYLVESKNEKFNDAYLELLDVIKKNIPKEFEWGYSYGMFGFDVPLSIYPQGYHCTEGEPLPFLGVAMQKQHLALYHMGIYMDESLLNWFTEAYNALNIGKLDMGKSCIRFRNPNKIPFELIGELVSKMSVNQYLSLYKATLK